MAKKEEDSPDGVIDKGHGYRVVWEEEEEVSPDEDKQPLNLWRQDYGNNPGHAQGIHTALRFHQQSVEYITGIIAFLVLVLLFFVNPSAFWVCFWIFFLGLALMLAFRKIRRGYVDRMQQNIVYLKIKNPILTGFEIALGIGIFGAICMLIGLGLFLLFAVGAGYGIWSLLSGFFP